MERPGQKTREGADALKQQVKAANRSRRSYKDFLRRFCVMREEVKLDPDEFDLNFYTYGLSVYGNLPLIEPLETRESKKIEELALVIDTSYSTSGALVGLSGRDLHPAEGAGELFPPHEPAPDPG